MIEGKLVVSGLRMSEGCHVNLVLLNMCSCLVLRRVEPNIIIWDHNHTKYLLVLFAHGHTCMHNTLFFFRPTGGTKSWSSMVAANASSSVRVIADAGVSKDRNLCALLTTCTLTKCV